MGTSDWWGDMTAHDKTTGFAAICGSILAAGSARGSRAL